MKLYQIDMQKDINRVKFCSTYLLEQKGLTVDPSIYRLVFDGDVPGSLEDLFLTFNTKRKPKNFRGHSMSVSDVVVTEDGAFFCDSVGFRKIDFDETKAIRRRVVEFGVYYTSYGTQKIEIPDDVSDDMVNDYIERMIPMLPVPSGSHVHDSDELDRESVRIFFD